MSGTGHSWKSEFEKRRGAFERKNESEGASEDESVLSRARATDESLSSRTKRRESEELPERGPARKQRSSPCIKTESMISPHHSSEAQQRASLTGQFSEEAVDSDLLHPLRPASGRTHQLAIGEETGQKERVIVHAAETISPAFSSQSQSDDSEREDLALATQINALSKQNEHLEALVREREQERDRLRELLERDKGAEQVGGASYLPPGLPYKVLDGREVMKTGDGHPLAGGGKAGDKGSREAALATEINAVRQSHRNLERRLMDFSEEKRKVEAELCCQREALQKEQERGQDLSKDIATLRDENSHQAETISKLQVEQERLQLENTSLHVDLTTTAEKLAKVQRCYRQVEQENMNMAEELREMERDRLKLYEHKMKLQLSVDDAQKTKENYRTTIKKLREENTQLKAQLSEAAKDKRPSVAPKPEKPCPVSKEQQAMNEMLSLREERSQLKDQLQSAQREIDSLATQIKGHSLDQQATNAIKRKVAAHLKELQSQLASVYDELEATRSEVTTLTAHHAALTKDLFLSLGDRWQSELHSAEEKGSKVAEELQSTEQSLSRLAGELESARASNVELRVEKSKVAGSVSRLKSETSLLSDQKRLLEQQLSQNESICQEKDRTLQLLGAEHSRLKKQLQSNEKTSKQQLVQLEREWQGRMAEMDLIQGNLMDEKEDLLREKAKVERRLCEVEAENRKLEEEKLSLEQRVRELDTLIAEMGAKLDDNWTEISRVESSIAKVVVGCACSAAKVRLQAECLEEELVSREEELKHEVCVLVEEKDTLTLSLAESQKEKEAMKAQVETAKEDQEKIEHLTTQLEVLSTENETIREEIKSLSQQRQSAVDNLQVLSEAEHSRQLDSQKIQMTLQTDIRLLKSKLENVVDEKKIMEKQFSELAAQKGGGVGGGGGGGGGGYKVQAGEGQYVEQLRRQVTALQGEVQRHRRENQELKEKKIPSADIQSRLAMLEAENRHLKDSLRTGKEPPDSNAALRKKIIKLSQKNFFLMWEKKQLVDKLQISLKVARETRDRVANDQARRLREENRSLVEKVRGLEESLLKRTMATDSRIAETVKENVRLHQRLVSLKSCFEEAAAQQALIEESLSWASEDGPQAVHEIETSLTSFKRDLQELAAGQERLKAVHSQLQQLMSSEAIGKTLPLSRTSSGSSQSLPPVLKSLNPSYLSRLHSSSPPPIPFSTISSPPSCSPSVPQSPTMGSETKEKLLQLSQATDEASTTLQSSLALIQSREDEVSSLGQQMATLSAKLAEVGGINKKLQDQFDRIEEQDMPAEQLQTIAMLQKQIECLEDKVFDRDAALQEIESQMKQDYEQHDQLIGKLKSQVLDLRDQLTSQSSRLRAKDQYLQQADSRYLEMETQLLLARKEVERMAHEREQLTAQALPEHLKMVAVATGGGAVSVGEVIRLQAEEIARLQDSLSAFDYQLSQLRAELESTGRERSALQAKTISMERMHQQMKEHLSADINYLRTLNLRFVEQQAKADKASVLLREVQKLREALKKQQDMSKLESELSAVTIKLHEQERKTKDQEIALRTHQISLTVLQAEKKHALSSLGKEVTSQMAPHAASGYLLPRRPLSAGNDGGGACRKPNYHFKSRGQNSSRNSLNYVEFAIQIPATKGSSQGGTDIVNLEEQAEEHSNPLSLGPTVVTDDESSNFVRMPLQLDHDDVKAEKLPKHQRFKSMYVRRHRRTASTGSNIHASQKDALLVSSTLPPQTSLQLQHVNIVKPKPLTSTSKHQHRPGSAGSNPTIELQRIESPEQICETAQEVASGIARMIGNDRDESANKEREGGGGDGRGMRRVKSGGVNLGGGGGGDGGDIRQLVKSDQPGNRIAVTTSLPVGISPVKSRHKYSEISRSKQAGKMADPQEPKPTPLQPLAVKGVAPSLSAVHSAPLNAPSGPIWSKSHNKAQSVDTPGKGFVNESGGGGGGREGGGGGGGDSQCVGVLPSSGSSGGSGDGPLDLQPAAGVHKTERPPVADLSRTPSILSTSSTISTFPPSTLPSRNPSFAYDGGGEESSPYSHDSVEIGDSIENLLALQTGKMNFSYFIPIRPPKPLDMTSSSDEDSVRDYHLGRRKRSSGTTAEASHNTPQNKDEDDNSNSSNDSDQLQTSGYHGDHRQSDAPKPSAPVCRADSISISAMEDCPTDHEVDEKAAQLRRSFPHDRPGGRQVRQGRWRTSSTGSLRVCYSDSNTSMEDVSRNL